MPTSIDRDVRRKWLVSTTIGIAAVVIATGAGPSGARESVIGQAAAISLPRIVSTTGQTEFAAVGRVVAIEHGLLNTPSGRWDPAELPGDLHDAYSQLLPIQRVTVAVETTLAGTPPTPMEVVLPGGEVRFSVTVEEAAAVGIKIQDQEPNTPLEGIAPPPEKDPVENLSIRMWVDHPLLEVGTRVMLAGWWAGVGSGGADRVTAGSLDGSALFFENDGQWVHFPTELVADEGEVVSVLRDLVP